MFFAMYDIPLAQKILNGLLVCIVNVWSFLSPHWLELLCVDIVLNCCKKNKRGLTLCACKKLYPLMNLILVPITCIVTIKELLR